MHEIPTLLEVLKTHRRKYGKRGIYAHCICGWFDRPVDKSKEDLHAEHQAEAYREARTIRDIEQLRAAPLGTLGRDTDGHLVIQDARGPVVAAASDHIEWPVLVVWTPRDEARQ